MKNKIFLIVSLLLIEICTAQTEKLYLIIDNPFFVENSNLITVGFGVKSKDKRFNLDYFNFRVLNFKGWNEEGEDIYLDKKQLRKKIDLNSIKYETVQSLTKNKEWWEVHNELSLKKEIYLLEKLQSKFNVESGNFDYEYYILPLQYEWTMKNIVPTDLSIVKE